MNYVIWNFKLLFHIYFQWFTFSKKGFYSLFFFHHFICFSFILNYTTGKCIDEIFTNLLLFCNIHTLITNSVNFDIFVHVVIIELWVPILYLLLNVKNFFSYCRLILYILYYIFCIKIKTYYYLLYYPNKYNY